MSIEMDRLRPDTLRVRVLENPGASTAHEWIMRFSEVLNGQEVHAVIDLKAIEIIASLAINVVVGIYQIMQKQDATIEVIVGNEKNRHVFELFRLTDLFEVKIAETPEKA